MAFVSEQVGTHYDELIGSTAVVVLTKNVTLAAATETLVRGTLLAAGDDGYAAVAAGGEASVVLAHDVELEGEAVVATVYTSGMFNRERLIVADDDTVDAHEEELRKVGIMLTSVQE